MNSSQITGLVVSVVIFAVFLILGFLLRSGRGASLIAGYNTAPPEQQKKINVKSLTRLVGNLLIGISGLVLVVGVAATFGAAWLAIAGVVAAIIAMVWAIVYANTNKKFKNAG